MMSRPTGTSPAHVKAAKPKLYAEPELTRGLHILLTDNILEKIFSKARWHSPYKSVIGLVKTIYLTDMVQYTMMSSLW